VRTVERLTAIRNDRLNREHHENRDPRAVAANRAAAVWTHMTCSGESADE
jgi:hypothetical protein